MKLEIGKRYRKADGTVETVGGLTIAYPEWVWTIQGNWYRQSDGRYITVSGKTFEPAPMSESTWRDLIEEKPNEN